MGGKKEDGSVKFFFQLSSQSGSFSFFCFLVHVVSIINFPSAASSIVARIFLFE